MSETDAIKSGDLVMLKSRGPTMTVCGPSENGELLCEWFDRQNVRGIIVYRPAMLAKAAPEAKGKVPLTPAGLDLLEACKNADANLSLFAVHTVGDVSQPDDDKLPPCLDMARAICRAAIAKAKREQP